MKWFKFYGQDWITDRKIRRLSIEDRLCFITLLCVVSGEENKDKIKDCREEDIISLSYTDPEKSKGVLSRLSDNKMITIDNDGSVIINNFTRRQGKNLSGYERVKRYREKQNKAKDKVIKENKNVINDNVNDNADDNARIDKNRIEYIYTEEEKKTKKKAIKRVSKDSSSIEEPFVWIDYIKKLEDDKRRGLQVIGFYLKEKKVKCDTRGEAQVTVRRYLKVASQIQHFSDDKIVEATEKVKKEYPDMWTLETIYKQLTK